MEKNSLTNQEFAALANGLPVSLTVTMEGTGSATAWISGNKIIVDCAAAQASKYVNVSTPIDFKLIDMMTIHGNATLCTVQAKNTGSAITDALAVAATDKVIDRALTVDDAYWEFDVDDNDLRFAIVTAAFTGRIICTIDK